MNPCASDRVETMTKANGRHTIITIITSSSQNKPMLWPWVPHVPLGPAYGPRIVVPWQHGIHVHVAMCTPPPRSHAAVVHRHMALHVPRPRGVPRQRGPNQRGPTQQHQRVTTTTWGQAAATGLCTGWAGPAHARVWGWDRPRPLGCSRLRWAGPCARVRAGMGGRWAVAVAAELGPTHARAGTERGRSNLQPRWDHNPGVRCGFFYYAKKNASLRAWTRTKHREKLYHCTTQQFVPD